MNVHIQDLCFVEGHSDQLTLTAQENLKRNLLHLARERASDDESPEQRHENVQHYYYDALASFMNDYPSVQIDLILIKLDEFPLN